MGGLHTEVEAAEVGLDQGRLARISAKPMEAEAKK